jgi:hypothetical protein
VRAGQQSLSEGAFDPAKLRVTG